MVMQTEPQETNDNIEFIQPVDGAVAEDVAPVEEILDTTEEVAPEEDVKGSTTVDTTGTSDSSTPNDSTAEQSSFWNQPAPEPKADQKTIDELQERRSADKQREWQESIGRRAQAFQQQLQDQGYMPEQAREQSRRYVQQEQRFRKQEQDSADMLGFLQGRQAAAIHYMKQEKLADSQFLDTFTALQNANTPDDMEREAKRMRRERALIAENTRLKQGRVAPQTFDNSQGSAEVTTNKDRLLDAYISGDRSEAAVQAAKGLLY